MAAVHHRSIDLGRKRRGMTPRELPIEMGHLPEDPHDTWYEVSNSLDRDLLIGCLDRIPEKQREVIQLAYFEGYTQREIAELNDIPLGALLQKCQLFQKSGFCSKSAELFTILKDTLLSQMGNYFLAGVLPTRRQGLFPRHHTGRVRAF